MKKFLSAVAMLLALVLMFSGATIGISGAPSELGDANKDGKIDTKDVLWLIKYLDGTDVPRTIRPGDVADVNCSNGIDTDDLRQVKRYIANRQKVFYDVDYTVTTTQKPTEGTVPITTNDKAANKIAPFYDGGVPATYYDQLAIKKDIRIKTDTKGNALKTPYCSVLVNHLGYATVGEKIAKLTEGFENSPSSANSLIQNVKVYLVDADENSPTYNKVVETFTSDRRGLFEPGLLNGEDDIYYSTVDMSGFNTPGTYRLYAPAGYSYKFTITGTPYNKVNDEMLMAQYYQRCGCDLDEATLQRYEDHLVANYGEQYSNYFETYKAYAHKACHIESTGANKGKEVVVVDTYKKVTAITFTYATAPAASTMKTLAESTVSNNGYYTVTLDNNNKKVVVRSISNNHLTSYQVDTIKAALLEAFSDKQLKFSSSSNSEGFDANRDADGNPIRLPATDFAYGLHDAGDFGRYVQPGAQTVGDLLAAYELYPELYTLDVVQDNPGENIPDILDQARWEAKFILNMQNLDKNSPTYGGFYFKICTEKFASQTGSIPYTDYSFNGTSDYSGYGGFRVMSVNFATTAASAGALAHCAYVFKDIDPDFAAECLEASKLGYDFYINNRKGAPANMSVAEKTLRDQAAQGKAISGWNTGGGSYGGTPSEADNSQFYMYAALYRAAGNYNNVHSKVTSTSSISTSMGSQAHGGFGSLIYILTAEDNVRTTDGALVSRCKSAFASGAAANETTVMNSSFGEIPCWGWGSNPGMVIELKENTIAYYLGYQSKNKNSYADTVRSVMNFMFGVNVLGYCFVTGQSERSPVKPHHYPSIVLQGKGNPCQPGILVGGYATESGFFEYIDSGSNYFTNEICIYWNSAATLGCAAALKEDMENSK